MVNHFATSSERIEYRIGLKVSISYHTARNIWERAGVRVRFLEWSTILQPPLNVLNTGLD